MLAAAALDATITHQQHKHPEQAALEVAALGQPIMLQVMLALQTPVGEEAGAEIALL